ncbi:MAG: hypothetical protein ACLUJG_10805 [Lawsonibacter sp.]
MNSCLPQRQAMSILGLPHRSARVGELGRAFKMNIVAYDPYLPAHVFEEQRPPAWASTSC